MTAEQAWHSAQAWRVWALSRFGAERDYGMRVADYWAAEYTRLSGRPMAPLPFAGPVAYPSASPRTGNAPAGYPTTGHPPSGNWGTAGPGYPPAGYGDAPAAGTSSATYRGYPPAGYPTTGYRSYQPAGFQPARPPERAGRHGLVVSMVVVGCIVLAVVLGLGARTYDQWFGTPVADTASPTQTAQLPPDGAVTGIDPLNPDGDTTSSGSTSAPAGTSLEAKWKAGDFALTLPDKVPTTRPQPSTFIPGYATPEQWLVASNAANKGIRVVFTDDPKYNCGVSWVAEHGAMSDGAAGCYRPVYPRVLFIYWGPNTSADVREFVLAHELSHLIQWWDHFDVQESAVKAGLADDSDWYHINETDATCRVLSWGGYNEEVAQESSSPCDTSDWSEDWLAKKAESLGVTVQSF